MELIEDDGDRKRYYRSTTIREPVEKNGDGVEGENKESIQHPGIRSYEVIIDCGLGNFVYGEYGSAKNSDLQSTITGDIASIKSSVKVIEIEGTWSCDVSGEVYGSAERVEKWWAGQKLFRVNRFFIKGISLETTTQYNFEEMGLSPFPVLAQPNLGFGLVYHFLGIRRNKIVNLIENDISIPIASDFAMFGIEPSMGLSFTMDYGKMMGYVNLGTGIYGVSVENNYEKKSVSGSLYKTYGRSILARIGLKGSKGRFFYHLGYTGAHYTIHQKDVIPKSTITVHKLHCSLGISF